jgi:hypothetical protein
MSSKGSIPFSILYAIGYHACYMSANLALLDSLP